MFIFLGSATDEVIQPPVAYVQEPDDAVGTGRFVGDFFWGKPVVFPVFFGGKCFGLNWWFIQDLWIMRDRPIFLAYHVVPGYGESQLTRFWMVCVWGVALESPDDSGAIHLQLFFFPWLIFGAMVCFALLTGDIQCNVEVEDWSN